MNRLFASCVSLFVFGSIANFVLATEAALTSTAPTTQASVEVTPPATSPQLPKEVDLRPQFREFGLVPRVQGHRGTCSVFTTVGALEFALAKRQGKGTPLSVEYLNWACNEVINNHTHDRGQFFHHLLEAYSKYGVCPEQEMPYQKNFDPKLQPSEKAAEAAKALLNEGFQIHWIRVIGRGKGLRNWHMKDIKETLAKGWPVAAGSDHSRLIVGYLDDDRYPGGGLFRTKDSQKDYFDSVTYEFATTKMDDVFWIESTTGPSDAKSDPGQATP